MRSDEAQFAFSSPFAAVKPTRLHYFYACAWPARLWFGTFSLGFGVCTAVHLWPLLLPPFFWLDALTVAGMVALMALLGYFIAAPLGWLVLGPVFYSRACGNGEPFKAGEMVHILYGPHRDRIARVYEVGEWGRCGMQHHVYVDLGAEAKEEGNDVFASTQVLRVPADDAGNAERA